MASNAKRIAVRMRKRMVEDMMKDLNQKDLLKMVQGGFIGYNNMSYEILTDKFIKRFGFAGYKEILEDVSQIKYYGCFDSSHGQHNRKSYISFAIRDEFNDLIYRDAYSVNVKDSYVGESLALLRLLDKALDLGIENLIVHGDCQNVIFKVNKRSQGKNGFNGYFPAIVNRMEKFNTIELNWQKRNKNKYADLMCKLARRGIEVKKNEGKFDIDELLDTSVRNNKIKEVVMNV